MARAMSCGFFWCAPDIIATGCQADAAQVAQSRDYLHMFFTSLTAAGRTMADSDRNGEITLRRRTGTPASRGMRATSPTPASTRWPPKWFEAHPPEVPRT